MEGRCGCHLSCLSLRTYSALFLSQAVIINMFRQVQPGSDGKFNKEKALCCVANAGFKCENYDIQYPIGRATFNS